MVALTKVELFGANNDGNPITYTVASSATIAQGSLLQMSDPRTAATYTGADGLPCAGIAAIQKTADWSTQISAWTQGIFKAVASGAIAFGEPLICAGGSLNEVTRGGAVSTASGACIIGYSMDSVADGETLNLRLNL